METRNYNGIEYELPTVILLNDSGIGSAELAARTCYSSFKNSESPVVRMMEHYPSHYAVEALKLLDESSLLHDLAWTHHHHSILEHATVTFLVRGISRAVLQEHARHRIQAISVKSTRYTMSSILNAFMASRIAEEPEAAFLDLVSGFDLYNIADTVYTAFEDFSIMTKLTYHYGIIGPDAFMDLVFSKEAKQVYNDNVELYPELFKALEKCKKKRNAGDSFKHIVTDNWKTDMVVTFNLRSLKNYFQLRDSGAAYAQIQWLAEKMKEATPKKYLDLIVKAN